MLHTQNTNRRKWNLQQFDIGSGGILRVSTRPGEPGKPGKMRVHLENLEISWNFEKFNKYHGKNDMKPGKT